METQQLGNSGLRITTVGYGAWAVGGSGWQFAWGAQDDNDSIAAMHRAIELGVNWIDTAPVYGMGHSEEVVARALKSWQGPKPYVFTKCVLRWDAQGNVSKIFGPIRSGGKQKTACVAWDGMSLTSIKSTGRPIPILRNWRRPGPPLLS